MAGEKDIQYVGDKALHGSTSASCEATCRPSEEMIRATPLIKNNIDEIVDYI